MLGTCMLIGDGILTPAISVLSAMDGLKDVVHSFGQAALTGVTVAILVIMFAIQRYGTSKVAFLFSPIMLCWSLSTLCIGAYNISHANTNVFKAISPHYVIRLFQRNGKDGMAVLGGTVLSITGAEAMFADLGHFNRHSMQLAFLCIVYPSLVITYAGQTAFLIKNPYDHGKVFYHCIPHKIYWPMFVLATLAAVVASQGLITACFSVIKQSMALDYFPRVKLVHTSHVKEGQIYCPEINYILMTLCLLAVLGFQNGSDIGNAYGVAVIMVMLFTTIFLALVMIIIWKVHIFIVGIYFICSLTVEGAYISAVLPKLPQGGWLPFVVSFTLATIMFMWYYGRQKKYQYEMANRIRVENIKALVSSQDIPRVSGACFLYSNKLDEIPVIFGHFIKTIGSVHEVVVFITVRHLEVTAIDPNDRYLVRSLGPNGFYRCIVHYGFLDSVISGDEFINAVMNNLELHVKTRAAQDMDQPGDMSTTSLGDEQILSLPSVEEAITLLKNAKEARVVHVFGKSKLQAVKTTNWVDRMLIENMYEFLHSICRSSIEVNKISAMNFVEIGMVYEV